MTAAGWIEAAGVRTHNLRDIDVRLPHRAIVAVTGVSGSRKSSLVLDTVHAEARLRYLEGFDPYLRKFLTPRDGRRSTGSGGSPRRWPSTSATPVATRTPPSAR